MNLFDEYDTFISSHLFIFELLPNGYVGVNFKNSVKHSHIWSHETMINYFFNMGLQPSNENVF